MLAVHCINTENNSRGVFVLDGNIPVVKLDVGHPEDTARGIIKDNFELDPEWPTLILCDFIVSEDSLYVLYTTLLPSYIKLNNGKWETDFGELDELAQEIIQETGTRIV